MWDLDGFGLPGVLPTNHYFIHNKRRRIVSNLPLLLDLRKWNITPLGLEPNHLGWHHISSSIHSKPVNLETGWGCVTWSCVKPCSTSSHPTIPSPLNPAAGCDRECLSLLRASVSGHGVCFLVKHLEKTAYVGCSNSTYHFFNQTNIMDVSSPWLFLDPTIHCENLKKTKKHTKSRRVGNQQHPQTFHRCEKRQFICWLISLQQVLWRVGGRIGIWPTFNLR